MKTTTFATWSTKIGYIIMKDGLFFDGCEIHGVDNEGVLRVSKCRWSSRWSTELHQLHLDYYEDAREILNGIKKYDSEANSRYEIVQVKIQTLVEKIDW